jgi:hypothetical protein
MRCRLKGLALLLSCAALLAPAGAQQPQQPPQRPQQPQPLQAQPPLGFQNPRATAEHRRLAFLLGTWEEKVSYPGPETREGSGRWVGRPALGLYVMFNYEGSGPEGNYRALGLLTWNRESEEYRMWWFDDAGGIGDYRGRFVDENTLAMEHRGKVEGRDFRERVTYRRVSPTEVRTRVEQAWGTEEYKVYLEATANRTGDVPPPGLGPAKRPPVPPER